MTSKIFQASISADGKLTNGQELTNISMGDQLEIIIDGTLLVGGAESKTLLGTQQEYLPQSHHFKLTELQPQSDGSCRLCYTVSEP